MESTGENHQPLAKQQGEKGIHPQTWQELLYHLTGIDLKTCPKCKKGILVRRPLTLSSATYAFLDSS
jgi:tRNA(His) 5'-end guanylyltransferase